MVSFPSFYDISTIGTSYTPNVQKAVEEGRGAGLAPSDGDTQKIALLLIDMQADFVHEDGSLSVKGAVGDTQRTLAWLYQHMGRVTTLAASLDSHLPLQIFSPSWWVGADGLHPQPYTVITSVDVKAGVWKALYHTEWSHTYVEVLEETAKKQLMIWTYHTLIGTSGHTLTPALYEALAFHASARQKQPLLIQKGTEPRTEHYSIIEPEVKLPDSPQNLNREFLEVIETHDLVYICGQAKSHCVLESVASMIRHAPHAVHKLRVLADCMSSVGHPTIDFDAIANEAFLRFARNGLTLVKSTDPIG